MEKVFGIPVTVRSLLNVGGSDHAYSHWIHENYPRIQDEVTMSKNSEKKDSSDDLILFIKDHNIYDDFRPFGVLVATALDSGFACPLHNSAGHEARAKKKVFLGLHDKKSVQAFTTTENPQFLTVENEFFKSKYSNLLEWSQDIGIVFPDSQFIRACYGGSFLTRKEGILTQSKNAWTNLRTSLSRGKSIEEESFAELSWASITAPPPYDLPLDVLSDKISPFISGKTNMWERGRLFINKEGAF